MARIIRTKRRMRSPRFQVEGIGNMSFKDYSVLSRFLTERGKILSRRVTGVSSKDQRTLTAAIKHARYLGLLTSGGTRR